MTDNEIIKALEQDKDRVVVLGGLNGIPVIVYHQDVIDLINRQKAEIERLNNNLNAMYATLSNSAKATRHEAIKEFAERLKAEMLKSKYIVTTSSYSRACNAVVDFWVEETDNIAKEMVGEDNA